MVKKPGYHQKHHVRRRTGFLLYDKKDDPQKPIIDITKLASEGKIIGNNSIKIQTKIKFTKEITE